MLLAITALDVAFVSAIAALIGATMTPLITWIVTAMKNRHDRWAVIYNDRRDAFLAGLEAAYNVWNAAYDCANSYLETGELSGDFAEAGKYGVGITTRLALFSSEEVRSAHSR